MADVRSLLRQQRASRRIDQPHAAYTEAGKLLCTLCRELVKAESLWEGHVQGDDHRRRLLSADKAPGTQSRGEPAGVTHKRKLDEGSGGLVAEEEDAVRRKRSRPDLALAMQNRSDRSTATPSRREASSSSTPAGLTPSLPSQGSVASTFLMPRKVGAFASPAGDAQTTSHTPSSTSAGGPSAAPALDTVDESEWAAFEADIAAETAPYDEDAVISAPAMTAEEAAAARDAAQQDGTRRAQADVDIEDERDEAKRAIEDEFGDMRELEARVTRLKEKREALRRGAPSHALDALPDRPSDAEGGGKENDVDAMVAETTVAANQSDEDEEDEDDDVDDWDGFMFRKQ
ncbi:hypothetical protein HIM_06914 [Hirsutella minnesotensis 3608]|uniref:Coiled-coil domain-containing protein 16 n=1 Tax=Hirsutella minnesotensis 3608 TaxID=1043627 RepID=A0A0F7ZIK1_9HYPO|nr:hypothetical protein HIM_06914 [Hirsutella minnesotensis 3608]